MHAKYHNKKTEYDGIKFASKKEATRYCELKQLERAGIIKDLRLQPRYTLQEKYEINGRKERAITYIADFEYYDNEKQKNMCLAFQTLKFIMITQMIHIFMS